MLLQGALGTTLNTKLMPPTKRSALVERQGLKQRLDQAQHYRLLLICAPAGYGKTSVLIQAHELLQRLGYKAGWISLDESDKDLSRFISYMIDAVRRTGIKFGQALTTLLSSGTTLSPDTLKTLVLNELTTLDQEVFLIFDDYHLVSAPEIRELVNTTLLSPIQQVRFLISSRTSNELPISRLRALGQLQEIEIADLMFSECEVSEFVSKVRGAPLNSKQVSRLREETEGWAASLQMAGIALRDVSDVDVFLDRFSGEHKNVTDFLSEEVLQRQPDKLQEFMILTSILKRFNWSLCNAVTDSVDGQTMIDEMERRNLFIFSLDHERHWYRYHHLFSDFLRRRFSERYPDMVTECHRRASTWLAENRFMTDAIEHAFSANDIERAGKLLDEACSDLFAAGQTATLMALSSQLSPEGLDRLPRLQLERAWYSELSWKFADARTALDRVQATLEERKRAGVASGCPETVFLDDKLAHRVMMLALLSDDMPRTRELAMTWIENEKTHDPFMCASAGSAVMAGNREMFHCEGVTTSARMLRDRFVEGGALYGIVFHQSIVGATFSERGDLDQAHDAYEQALQMAMELHGEHSALYNMPSLMLAELHYERNQLHQAEEALAQRYISSELGFVDNLIAGFLTRSRLLALRGRHADADNTLEEGGWLATQYRFERMQVVILNERIRLFTMTNRGKEAHALLRDFWGSADTISMRTPGEGVTTRDLYLAIASARVSIKSGNASDAVALLKPWVTFARERHCYRSAIRAGTLLACALNASGDRRAALRMMVDCLSLGESGRFVRSFVDEGSEVLELLREVNKAYVPQGTSFSQDYIRVILESAEGSDLQEVVRADRPVNTDTSSMKTLSQREIQILDLGAHGLRNTDIAESLFLGESTIKWYWQRIFDKLNVRRRSDAIKRARLLQWIS